MRKNSSFDCENCSHYVIEPQSEEYICDAPLDEDDTARLITSPSYRCPYFDFYDEYKIVRKQN